MAYVGRSASGMGADAERAFFITNTQESGQQGAHWISVAIGMQYQ